MKIKEAKTHLRRFMQANYTDERLAWLLAHARAGKLAYNSCCCFIAVPTADHALKLHVLFDNCGVMQAHYRDASALPGATDAEEAYRWLAGRPGVDPREDMGHDIDRRRIIIPMILAEQRRRERKRAAENELDQILAEIRTENESTKELTAA